MRYLDNVEEHGQAHILETAEERYSKEDIQACILRIRSLMNYEGLIIISSYFWVLSITIAAVSR